MSRVVIEPSIPVDSIRVFFETSLKKDNDSANKLRERILCEIEQRTIPSGHYVDPGFGDRWRIVSDRWREMIRQLFPGEYTFRSCGGRTYRHDFEVEHEGRIERIEFKVGRSIWDAPQVIQLSAFKSFLPGYPKYYYDNYLPARRPDWATYESEVRKIKSDHPFFLELRNAKPADAARRSIAAFLAEHGPSIDLQAFEREIDSVFGKTYIMWSIATGSFSVERLEQPNGWRYVGVTHNSVILESGRYICKLMLRWKNRNGVLNPAWQVSLQK